MKISDILDNYDYDQKLSLSLDWEVFSIPDEVLRMYKYNPYVIKEYGPERLENAKLVSNTIKLLCNQYKRAKKAFTEYKMDAVSCQMIADFYNIQNDDELRGVLVTEGTNEWRKDIVKSHRLVTMSYDFDTIENRVMLKIVEVLQKYIRCERNNDNIAVGIIDFIGTGKMPMVILPIKSVLPEGSTNYSRVKESLRKLSKGTFEICGNRDWEYKPYGQFLLAVPHKSKGKICVVLSKEFWKVFSDLDRYHIFNSDVARSFKTVQAERMYELLSSEMNMEVRIEDIKRMLGKTEKYNNNGDFMKRVIDPAMKEIQEKENCQFSFTYRVNRGSKNNSIETLCIDVTNKS